MSAASRGTTVTCPHCDKRNRVRLATACAPRCGACGKPLPWLVDVDQASFGAAAEQSPLPVLVDFWAPWCVPSRMLEPAVQQLSRELAGRLKVVRANADLVPELGQRFRVGSIPTLILLHEGQPRDRLAGAPNAAALRSWLKAHVGPPQAAEC